jgi:ATP-dependent Lon protease
MELILPKDNEADLDKLPESVRNDLRIHLVERLEEVVEIAIPGLQKHTAAKPKAKKTRTRANGTQASA